VCAVREDEAEQLEELRELGRSGAIKVTDILGAARDLESLRSGD